MILMPGHFHILSFYHYFLVIWRQTFWHYCNKNASLQLSIALPFFKIQFVKLKTTGSYIILSQYYNQWILLFDGKNMKGTYGKNFNFKPILRVKWTFSKFYWYMIKTSKCLKLKFQVTLIICLLSNSKNHLKRNKNGNHKFFDNISWFVFILILKKLKTFLPSFQM